MSSNDTRQRVWFPEDVQRVAREEGLPIHEGRYSFGGMLVHPEGFSRRDLVRMLRLLCDAPAEEGATHPSLP